MSSLRTDIQVDATFFTISSVDLSIGCIEHVSKQMICRGLMWKAAGDMSYVGFTEDGAQWLVDNTDIKLVGKWLHFGITYDTMVFIYFFFMIWCIFSIIFYQLYNLFAW